MRGARVWAMLLALLLLQSCTSDADKDADADTETGSVTQPANSATVEEGPLKATVSLVPESPLLGDPLTLTLTVESQAGVEIEMPAFGEALGRFSILDFTPRQSTTADGTSIASQRYRLQAPMSGRQQIPQLRIEYVDARTNADAPIRELLTDELSVEIQSVLPDGDVVDELRPARPALPESRVAWWARYGLWIVFGVILIGAALVAFGYWQRRAGERNRITAYERALTRLEQLQQRGVPDHDSADQWYVELSDIVRRYIEDRYAVRAPELTTEEFLQEARKSVDLSAQHRDLLTDLLARCDQVKFAGYNPEGTESHQALGVARQFLTETRLEVAA